MLFGCAAGAKLILIYYMLSLSAIGARSKIRKMWTKKAIFWTFRDVGWGVVRDPHPLVGPGRKFLGPPYAPLVEKPWLRH